MNEAPRVLVFGQAEAGHPRGLPAGNGLELHLEGQVWREERGKGERLDRRR